MGDTVESLARAVIARIADLENRRSDEIPTTKADWRLLMDDSRALAELCVTNDMIRSRVEVALKRAGYTLPAPPVARGDEGTEVTNG